MDPNATLARIRELTAKILDRPRTISSNDSEDPSAKYSLLDTAQELAEQIEVLNRWIASGGFLPEDWAQ